MPRTPPIKAEVLKLTRDAREFVIAAVSDIRRDDRIDALDMLRLAKGKIERAEQRIRDTLPEVLK